LFSGVTSKRGPVRRWLEKGHNEKISHYILGYISDASKHGKDGVETNGRGTSKKVTTKGGTVELPTSLSNLLRGKSGRALILGVGGRTRVGHGLYFNVIYRSCRSRRGVRHRIGRKKITDCFQVKRKTGDHSVIPFGGPKEHRGGQSRRHRPASAGGAFLPS